MANTITTNNIVGFGYAPCGCYTGIWMGVTPPPRCAAHAEGVASGGVGAEHATAIEEFLVGHTVTRSNNLISNAITNAHISPPSLDVLFSQMGEEIGRHLGKAIAKGDDGTAERDLWTMAMQHLEALRVAVDRARKP